MLTRPGIWGGVLAAVVLGAAAPAAGASRSASLTGIVLAAPAAPVCMPLVPCLRPAAGVVLVFKRSGVVRARVTTARDGTYRISLAPGTYAVRVVRPLGIGKPSPATVSLAGGSSRHVTFYLDTGIR